HLVGELLEDRRRGAGQERRLEAELLEQHVDAVQAPRVFALEHREVHVAQARPVTDDDAALALVLVAQLGQAPHGLAALVGGQIAPEGGRILLQTPKGPGGPGPVLAYDDVPYRVAVKHARSMATVLGTESDR